MPLVSNLNTAPGKTLPNSVYTGMGPVLDDDFNLLGWGFDVYNNAGTTHLLADVVGRFYVLDSSGSLVRAGTTAAPSSVAARFAASTDNATPLLQSFGRGGRATN
jgi:hypothetical protein